MEKDKNENPKPEGDLKPEGDPKPEGEEGKDNPPAPPTESEIVKKIKEDFEKREAALKEDFEKQLADKDKLILEILDGKPTPPQTIADRVNQNRIIKKY